MKTEITNPLIKDKVRFIKTAAETGGELTQVEVTLMAGGGTPLHYHRRFSETFMAIDGVLWLELKDKTQLRLQPGEAFTVERGVLHRFHNPGTKAIRFQVTIQPASQGFEYSLRIMYGLAADGLTNKNSIPKSLVHTSLILEMGDTNAPGLLTLLSPLFNWFARRAKKKGVEDELIRRYCV